MLEEREKESLLGQYEMYLKEYQKCTDDFRKTWLITIMLTISSTLTYIGYFIKRNKETGNLEILEIN